MSTLHKKGIWVQGKGVFAEAEGCMPVSFWLVRYRICAGLSQNVERYRI